MSVQWRGAKNGKEQIMRSATYTFAAALLAATWQFSPASAQTPPTPSAPADTSQAQSPADRPPIQSPADTPPAQSPAPDNPAATILDQKLDATAAAMQRVASLKRDYIQLLEATSPDDQPRIVNEASNAIEKAVTDQGLSVEEYTAILQVAEDDPQLRQKIIDRIQASAK
jgi:hypothetical protein